MEPPQIFLGGACGKGLQGPQAYFAQYKCLNSCLQRFQSAAVCSPPAWHMGTSIVTGRAGVWVCISSLARGMRQLTNGSNKGQGGARRHKPYMGLGVHVSSVYISARRTFARPNVRLNPPTLSGRPTSRLNVRPYIQPAESASRMYGLIRHPPPPGYYLFMYHNRPIALARFAQRGGQPHTPLK